MSKESSALLMYRRGSAEFLLVHPGGPFWKNKDAGAWTIPKGELKPGEEPLLAAQREFEEELGFKPHGPFIPLSPIKQKAGKLVRAWAFEGDFDTTRLQSNTFSMEWPPRSGHQQEFPEVDRAAFFHLNEAKEKINPAQVAFLIELSQRLEGS
ncbi:MAG TPA: NUDIX domain-containing protein [Verrucomicrobiae bacterium]|nr:NUDIX domain-containing protein [Verrucomicrobiae bacterium]